MNCRSQANWTADSSMNALLLSSGREKGDAANFAVLFENDIFDLEGFAELGVKAASQLLNTDDLASHLFGQLFAANDVHAKESTHVHEPQRGRQPCRQQARRFRRECGSVLPPHRGTSNNDNNNNTSA